MKAGLPVEVVEKAQDSSTQIVDLICIGQRRDPQGGNCDERAAAHDSFCSDGGGLCDPGAGKERVAVSEFTESFLGEESNNLHY